MGLYCRTPELREELCREFFITPVAHLTLLNGQRIHSDAGGYITENYFRFKAIHRRSGQEETIVCGYPTGCHFCDLLGVDRPPLFNPLQVAGAGGGRGGGGGVPRPRWNPTMLQLSNAVNILLSYLAEREESPLLDIKAKIDANLTRPPFISLVKAVNTIIGKYGTTMTDILDEIERRNGPIRNFEFTHLIDILNREGIAQNFVV